MNKQMEQTTATDKMDAAAAWHVFDWLAVPARVAKADTTEKEETEEAKKTEKNGGRSGSEDYEEGERDE